MSEEPLQPQRPQYVFGPVALARRIVRWHLTAPHWQPALLTIGLLLLIFIALTWGKALGVVGR